jgi:glycosyltransferase involved in cell wall biosynthesis
MRVAIDGRPLQHRPRGGVGRSLDNLLPHLARYVEIHLLLDRALPPIREIDGITVHALGGPSRLRGPGWLHLAVRPWLRANPMLFHGTFNAVPYRCPTPSVVSIHDLAFEEHPEWFRSRLQAELFRRHARSAVRQARLVVTVSEHMKRRLIACYGLPDPAVRVVPNGVDPAFRPVDAPTSAAVAAEFGLSSPFVLALGGAPRRNSEIAIAACELARRSQRIGDLVVIGQGEDRPGVRHLGPFDDERWPRLLAAAHAFCYPTADESFGMPALEAAASGTPVVCGRVGALPEVLGDAAVWAGDLTPPSFAEALARLASTAEVHERYRQLALDRAAGWPTWAQLAATLVATYEEAAA